MLKLKKNKKGVRIGFAVIIGIIILLLTFSAIFTVIKAFASKSDEKLQVDACRITNAIKFGLKEKTKWVISVQQACTTIDKTKPKLQVPTRDYPKTKEGAELEIREMIKNCWYMWLEGSVYNMFEKTPWSSGCFTCYTFKIKEGIEDVTFSSLEQSMNEPFFVADKSDNCAGNGGFLRTECEKDEKATQPKDEFKDTTLKCCVKKDLENKCENKGGKCSSEGAPKDFPNIYNEWQCPKNDQSCYVAEDSEYSYLRYIREYEARGGEIMFIAPEEGNKDIKDVAYEPGKIYAISFVSPSEQFCATNEEGKDLGCYAKIGAYAVGAIGLGVAAGYGIAAIGVGAVGSFLLGLSWPGLAASIGFSIADTAVEELTGTSIIDLAKDKAIDFVASPISVKVPNFMVVSTLEHAQDKLGCTIEYGG